MLLKYNEEFCGSLPLNFINHIQSYGMLLVLERESLKIIQASQNTNDFLGKTHDAFIDKPLSDFIPALQYDDLKRKLNAGIKEKLPFRLSFAVNSASKDFLCIIHAKEDYLLAEMEPIKPSEITDSSFIGIYQELKYIMANIDSAESLEDACQVILKELKAISGFERIMIYQFDEHWNGTVIAETLAEGMAPYLNLRFPASDIPKQARALYLKNPYRLIPDREYEPVKLYPVINPATQSFVDLSDCNLRSVPGVHIEYLRNMNVRASMSTRIIVDGKLWGLISCHHRQPKYLSYEMCSVFELLSGVISARISSLQQRKDYELRESLQGIQSQLIEQIYSDDLVRGLTEGKSTILDLLNADGAAIIHNRHIETIGKTPDTEAIQNIAFWLQTQKIDKVYTTQSILEVYDDGYQQSKDASGMIVLPINAVKGEYIIAFRPEVIQIVDWGGNPNEAVQFEKDNKNYHPRNSFSLWQQTVKNRSLHWKLPEVAIAENFRQQLLEYSIRKAYV